PAHPDAGAAAYPLLTRLFHEVVDRLLAQEGASHWHHALAEEDLNRERWCERLIDRAYNGVVAAQLQAHEAVLGPYAGEVCTYWEAVQGLCRWIVQHLWQCQHASGRFPPFETFTKLRLPPVIELHEAAWSDAVAVTDVDQSLWRVASAEVPYALELRTAQPGEQSGLDEACLYYLLAELAQPGKPEGRVLALVSFTEAVREQRFEAQRLAPLLRHTRRLIGQAAGAVPAALPVGAEGKGMPSEYLHLGKVLLEILREDLGIVAFAGPPQVEKGSVQFIVGLPLGRILSNPGGLAQRIRSRLKLKSMPVIASLAGQLLVTIELRSRPIVFFWPSGWGGHG
ncbi:MAG: hypothetical protein ACREWG_00035, partial [Gammaproteobacteria bacterium]